MPEKSVWREPQCEEAAGTHLCSEAVNNPTLMVSQSMQAWNLTDDECKNQTLMKGVMRISWQMKAQSTPLPAASTVPPVVSPAKAGPDVSNIMNGHFITNGSNKISSKTSNKTSIETTSAKRKRDAPVLPGQEKIWKTARQVQQGRINEAIH